MSHSDTPESRPEAPADPGSKPEPRCSERKHQANRINAQSSTGPRSIPGKNSSRMNSLKHGHYALIVPVPGEDPALFQRRHDAWRAELNPQEDEVGDYLVTVAVRKSLRLDRFDVASTARVAKLARDAVKDRSIARAKGIEEAIRIMLVDPDIAVRRLRETPEGCDLLIKEWGYLKGPLIEPPQWDLGDAARAHCLMADFSVARAKAPGLLAIPTRWIEEHREVSRKLKENERPTWIDWTRRYMTKDEHEYDKERVDELREASKAGQVWVSELIEVQIKGLVELREGLLAEDAIDVEQASLRARFDASDEGKVLHKHEAETERALLRVIDVLRGGVKAWRSAIQAVDNNQVMSNHRSDRVVAPPAAASGNEPTGSGPTHRPDLARKVEDGGVAHVDIAATPPTDRPNRE